MMLRSRRMGIGKIREMKRAAKKKLFGCVDTFKVTKKHTQCNLEFSQLHGNHNNRDGIRCAWLVSGTCLLYLKRMCLRPVKLTVDEIEEIGQVNQLQSHEGQEGLLIVEFLK